MQLAPKYRDSLPRPPFHSPCPRARARDHASSERATLGRFLAWMTHDVSGRRCHDVVSHRRRGPLVPRFRNYQSITRVVRLWPRITE